MSRWAAFYASRLGSSYTAYAARRYRPFLDCVSDLVISGDRVVEAGCGLATVTRCLARRGLRGELHAFDLDPVMRRIARRQLRGRVPVHAGDIRQPVVGGASVVHGHGVLEHFSDADIRRTIAAHRASGARYAVHYVPGEQYETPSFGDERLLSADDWRRIANPSEVVPFNDDFDFALLWRF